MKGNIRDSREEDNQPDKRRIAQERKESKRKKKENKEGPGKQQNRLETEHEYYRGQPAQQRDKIRKTEHEERQAWQAGGKWRSLTDESE